MKRMKSRNPIRSQREFSHWLRFYHVFSYEILANAAGKIGVSGGINL